MSMTKQKRINKRKRVRENRYKLNALNKYYKKYFNYPVNFERYQVKFQRYYHKMLRAVYWHKRNGNPDTAEVYFDKLQYHMFTGYKYLGKKQ